MSIFSYPKLGLEYKKKALSESQISQAKEMLVFNSERYVAKHFGVGRMAVRYYCRHGVKEYCIEKSKVWRQNNKEKYKEIHKQSSKKLNDFRNAVMPDRMRAYQKRVRDHYGKEYYRKKQAEYRKRKNNKLHPNVINKQNAFYRKLF